MAGLTIAFDAAPHGQYYSAPYKVKRGTATFDSSYPLGGEATTAGLFKLSQVADLRFDRDGDYTFQWDKTNAKVKAFWNKAGLSVSSTIAFTHDASAASNGIALYVHRDETFEQGTALGHLECVNAGNADSYVATSGGSKIMVQDDDAAATAGFQVFVNEDDTGGLKLTADMDVVTGTDTSAAILVPIENGGYLKIFDQDNPAGETGTVALYFDDDAATTTARLLYVSPTTTSSTDRLWVPGGEVPSGTDLSAVAPRFKAEGK